MCAKADNISANYRLANKLQDYRMLYVSAAIIIAFTHASAKMVNAT